MIFRLASASALAAAASMVATPIAAAELSRTAMPIAVGAPAGHIVDDRHTRGDRGLGNRRAHRVDTRTDAFRRESFDDRRDSIRLDLGIDAHRAGTCRFASDVDDVDAEFARLTAQGVVFTQPPTDIGTVVVAVFDDTCGNLIQIVAPKPDPVGEAPLSQ